MILVVEEEMTGRIDNLFEIIIDLYTCVHVLVRCISRFPFIGCILDIHKT